MAKKEILIDNKKVTVEANASTILIYEDTFKGRRFLQDIEEFRKIKKDTDIPISTLCRIIWATAKTADKTIPDMFTWSAQFSIPGLIGAGKEAIEVIDKDITPTIKNSKSATNSQ